MATWLLQSNEKSPARGSGPRAGSRPGMLVHPRVAQPATRAGCHDSRWFITGRCSRPSRLSRRVRGTRRASRPAAERRRYTDTGKDPNGERPRLKHPNCSSSPSLPTWGRPGSLRSTTALNNLGFVQQAARAGAFRARKLAGASARSGSDVSYPTAEPSHVGALCRGLALSSGAASDQLAGAQAQSKTEALVRGFRITTRCSGRTRVSRRLLKGASVAPRGAPLNAGVMPIGNDGVTTRA